MLGHNHIYGGGLDAVRTGLHVLHQLRVFRGAQEPMGLRGVQCSAGCVILHQQVGESVELFNPIPHPRTAGHLAKLGVRVDKLFVTKNPAKPHVHESLAT